MSKNKYLNNIIIKYNPHKVFVFGKWSSFTYDIIDVTDYERFSVYLFSLGARWYDVVIRTKWGRWVVLARLYLWNFEGFVERYKFKLYQAYYEVIRRL